MKKDVSVLLKNLCCSGCKTDFDEKSIKYIQTENDYSVINIVCQNCGKDFGTAFLKLTKNSSKNTNDLILKDKRDLPAIDYDDVIDAHRYIKNLEVNLKNFMKD